MLRGSIEALDADAGRLTLRGPFEPRVLEIAEHSSRDAPALRAAAADAAPRASEPCQLESDGVWALALPFGFASDAGEARGAVARRPREARRSARTSRP